MKVLHLAALAAALACAGCGGVYKPPIAGTATAELVVRPAVGGNNGVKEYVYRTNGRPGDLGQLMAAFFLRNQAPQVVKLPAGQEFFMRYSGEIQLHIPPMTCSKTLAFTPVEGHSYQLDHAFSARECVVFIYDLTTNRKIEARAY
jgi:hypothetical protein